MARFSKQGGLPRYLRVEQERIEAEARAAGLDFFPTMFEMINYREMNEIAAYGGFPTRYPHWRFGMEYEQLAKSTEYGLSKIYELVINNNPAVAYLLEGNSLTDQKLVMCHVYAHVDFFKNNFSFRATDLDATAPLSVAGVSGAEYNPDRRWIDRLANHASTISRIIDRHGIDQVEQFIDHCLSLENLIDPWSPFVVRTRLEEATDGEPQPVDVPRLRAKEYMESFINPEDYLAEQGKQIAEQRKAAKGKVPRDPAQDVLLFLLNHAPLEKWERAVLSLVRDEAYYFLPQMQTKIMNEGWASYWHSRLMTEGICDASEIVDYADNNAAVMATSQGQLNPYKLGVELYRHIEERWDKGQFGREWEALDNLDRKAAWNQRTGLGRKKIFEVRALYNDVTFIDEFLTPEFAAEQKLFSFEWSNRNERYEIATRQFQEVKEKLLSQLANMGNPVIRVVDANHENRGELLLEHQHLGVDLRADYCKEAMRALHRVWKRPVRLATRREEHAVLMRFDGGDFEVDTLGESTGAAAAP